MSPGALSYIARHARGPLMRSQPDHRLAALVRSGSEPAFEALVARYRDQLLRYCRRILSADRAEDAVQQTFVNAHAAIAGGRCGAELRPWLYRIAHNVAVDQLRQRRRPDEQLSEDLPGGDLPEDIFSRRERLAAVMTALEDLPPRQRDALLLRELEGRSYDEIAYALGVGDGAVRQLLNRARNAMRATAAALVPPAVLSWTPDQPGRAAEVAGGAGATTVVVKSWLGGLIAAASIGGAVAVPIVSTGGPGNDRPAPAEPHEVAPGPETSSTGERAGSDVVVRVANRSRAGAREGWRSGAPESATGNPERSSPPTPDAHPRDPAGAHPRDPAGAVAPRHADEGDDADNGDDPTDGGPEGADAGADGVPEPPDHESHDGGDHAGATGDEGPSEIESDGEDPPEVAPVDEAVDE